MLADELDYVVGVDTHRDEHVLAIMAAASGAVLARRAVRAKAGDYREALRGKDDSLDAARTARAVDAASPGDGPGESRANVGPRLAVPPTLDQPPDWQTVL